MGENAEVKIKKKLEKNTREIMGLFLELQTTDTVIFPKQLMRKAVSKEKADCIVIVEQNGEQLQYNLSIKFLGGSSPSIVNQERRSKEMYWGKMEEKNSEGLAIGHLDLLFQKLNYQRAIGEKSEDIPFEDIPWTEPARQEMENLLIHHTFIGAGAGAFDVQANCVLEVGCVSDTSTWTLRRCFSNSEKRSYIQAKWNCYTYAIRAKGMLCQSSYEKNEGKLAKIDAVWGIPFYIDREKKKGSMYPFPGCEKLPRPWFQKPRCTLNIRMKK